MKKLTLSLFFLSLSIFSNESLKFLTPLVLEGDEGGKVNGESFHSQNLKEKVSAIFYVDPDHKDLNDSFAKALEKENFKQKYFQSVAIINMEATWLPNFAISSSLKEKQKEYPRTLYVKDMNKKVVKKWGLGDNTSSIVIASTKNQIVFHKDGMLNSKEIQKAITSIKEEIGKLKKER